MAATASAALRPKDYKSDLKPVWCPGCGDFAVLAAITKALSERTPDRLRIIAQAMRAVLLAQATAATLGWLRAEMSLAH